MRKILVVAICFGMGLGNISKATHLLGGYFSYTYLASTGNLNKYKITLQIYRDCAKDWTPDEVPFDKSITICCYNSKGLFTSYNADLTTKGKVTEVSAKCEGGWNACFEKATYEINVDLPNDPNGYQLKWERCCLREFNNLKNDNTGKPLQGETFSGFIPNTNLKNNSPEFNEVPITAICVMDTAIRKHVFTDKDGDSLSYKFVTPLQGATGGVPAVTVCPDNEIIPPNVDYTNVNGFSAINLFGIYGLAKLNDTDGTATFFAPNGGYYALTIEISEWRKGLKIGSYRLNEAVVVTDIPFSKTNKLGKDDGIKLFPNPANKTLHIETGEKGDFEWQMLDLSGRAIMSGSGNMVATIATSQLAGGLYMVNVGLVGEKHQSGKMVSKLVSVVH